ncbi:MAG TPA: hypothetical protein VFB16_03150 [Bauldia sp.]|nr:hypothetical protein [Bauldia sp.]
MSLRFALVAGFVTVLGLAGPVFADPIADGIAALPGAVEDVRIGGTWEKDGKTGAYRIFIARSGGEKVTARLFVQWVADNEDGSTTIENTIEIKELTEKKVDVVDYTSESDADGISIYIEAIDPSGEGDTNYELHITSPTEYKFGPASN